MISLKDIAFKYRSEEAYALDHISISFNAGEWTSIIGHNGSGKSTLVKIIMGIIEDYEGEIYVGNELLTEENKQRLRRKFAIVFQNPDNQFVGATVEDDVAFGLENLGLEREKMIARTEHALGLVNMLEFRSHEPHRLSGGQKQRVAIAGALALQPDVLILDEATSMLDPAGRNEVLSILWNLHEQLDTTILYITHDLTEIDQSDKVIVMNDGSIVGESTVEEIYRDKEMLARSSLKVPYTVEISNALLDGSFVTHDELVVRLL